MYFEITRFSQSILPHTTQLFENLWLHQSHKQLFHGYRLGQTGGNFINFNHQESKLCIELSFYKDFCLGQDLVQGVLLTNISKRSTTLPQTATLVQVSQDQVSVKHHNIKPILQPSKLQSKEQVTNNVKKILIENLEQIKYYVGDLCIAYSGGLDSSTLAWLAHEKKMKFTAVVDRKFKNYWPSLPFNCRYSKLEAAPAKPQFSWLGKTVEHFYNDDHCVGGFYGDIAVLHHNDLYHQCQNLINHVSTNSYHADNRCQLPYFRNNLELKTSIMKVQLTPQFRHWFDHCEIFDPYRDPRVVETVMQLSLCDLVEQFDSAYIQRQILDGIDANCVDFICDHKNDYTKFNVN